MFLILTHGAGHIRDDGNIGAGLRRFLVPFENAGIGQRGGGELSRHAAPGGFLRGLQVQAAEVDAPAGKAFLIAQGIERDGHFHRPLGLGVPGNGGPFVVPAQVCLATIEKHAVPLRTGGIGAESEAVELIVERIDEDDEVVILEEAEIPPK